MFEHLFTTVPPPPAVRTAYGPDPVQFAELRLPGGPGPHPVVIVVHGGYWRAAYGLAHIGHLCHALTAAGLATWNVEYRRVGHRGGGWPGTLLDVAAAADHLRAVAPRYNLDLGCVVALGHSAGGHLALWLAARLRLAPGSPLYQAGAVPLWAVVALAPVADLRFAWDLHLSADVAAALLGGPPDRVPERYAAASPAELLPLGVAQTVIHGDADVDVPPEMSARYVAAARAAGDPVTLVRLPGVEHFALIDPESAVWPVVLAAVRAGLEGEPLAW